MMRGMIAAALFAAIFASALQLVTTRHSSRRLFVELQELRKEQDELNRQWSQLLLEQATWGTRGRIEDIARGQLGMVAPSQIRVERVRW